MDHDIRLDLQLNEDRVTGNITAKGLGKGGKGGGGGGDGGGGGGGEAPNTPPGAAI